MNYKLWLTYAVYLFTIFGTILAFLFSALFPQPVTAKAVDLLPRTLDSEINRLTVKYSIDKNLAYAIMSCESSLKPEARNVNFDKANTAWSADIGYWQINDYFHKSRMNDLGLDINNQWDNLEYGFILLKASGTQPWSASKGCWSKLIG